MLGSRLRVLWVAFATHLLHPSCSARIDRRIGWLCAWQMSTDPRMRSVPWLARTQLPLPPHFCSMRAVQPLRRVTCDERNVWSLPPWVVDFESPPGPWTRRIADAVLGSLPLTDARELEASSFGTPAAC